MTIKATVTKISSNFYSYAAQLGVPSDSLIRFLDKGYYPQPKQLEFHAAARAADENGATEICYGGARGGGKTHCVFAGTTLDDCQLFPELNVLFLRKKAGSAEESLDNLTRRILKNQPHTKKYGLVKFPNGSQIKIGHFQYEKDIDNYLSLEYDCIIIEQAEQLTPAKLVDILSVNRTSRTDYKPRVYYTLNWGGVSHAYLKKKFYVPFINKAETTTRFIPATVDDNRKVDKAYRGKLEQLTGWKRKAWLEGSPDIAAGQFFTTFNYDAHSIAPEDIPGVSTDIAEFWCAIDYGWNHYTSCHLFMRYEGVVYVLVEYAARMTSVEDNATEIKNLLTRSGLSLSDLSNFVAGTDVFAQRGAKNAETIADQYAEHGIFLTPANTDRINGAAKILKLLGDPERNLPPKIKIARTCVRLLECLPALEHDPNRPEDVKKVDTDENGNGGDDAYDSARYGVMVSDSAGVYF